MMVDCLLASESGAGNFIDMLVNFWNQTGFVQADWRQFVMLGLACVLFYLAIVKKFEPLLLLPIAFGVFIVNIPGAHDTLFMPQIYAGDTIFVNSAGQAFLPSELGIEVAKLTTTPLLGVTRESLPGIFEAAAASAADGIAPEYVYIIATSEFAQTGGLFYFLYKGVEWVIFPPIIFLGIGAMTDFGPLISNPKSLLLGAAAQFGIFITLIGGLLLGEFFGIYNAVQSASIAIIGGADGPTAIYVTSKLSPDMLGIIAIAAYSYMALVPVIQPPIMRLLTTKKERSVKMDSLRTATKLERIVFPIVVTLVVAIILPSALPLLGMLMFGNIMRESGVVERLVKTASNELINIVTIFLGVVVGTKAYAPNFLNIQSLLVIALGLIAFSCGTAGGLLLGKLMYKLSGGKINPLIGSAGVSAVPMAARISQKVGAEDDPTNFLLMHAMGPNVAGVIGSAVAAGVLLAVFG